MAASLVAGRNRYRAARKIGSDFPTVEYNGDDPRAFVVSANLHRRHLTESQRAMVAAKPANLKAGDNQHTVSGGANLPDLPAAPTPVTVAEAADLLNVSERSVRSARKVIEKAAPEIVSAVERGDLSVSLAAKATALPKEDQAAIVIAAEDRKVVQQSVIAAPAGRTSTPSLPRNGIHRA